MGALILANKVASSLGCRGVQSTCVVYYSPIHLIDCRLGWDVNLHCHHSHQFAFRTFISGASLFSTVSFSKALRQDSEDNCLAFFKTTGYTMIYLELNSVIWRFDLTMSTGLLLWICVVKSWKLKSFHILIYVGRPKNLCIFWYFWKPFSTPYIVENISFVKRVMALYLWFTEQYRAVQSHCTVISTVQSYWNAFVIVAKQWSAEVHILWLIVWRVLCNV